jgi:hypothetical protein
VIVLKWLAVAAAMAVVDTLWTLYIKAAAEGHANRAALWSCLIVLAGGFTTLAYVHDDSLLYPACIGAYIGTYLTTRFSHK